MINPPDKGWNWIEDRQWARGYLWVLGQGAERSWTLEVRELNPAGSRRLGLLKINGAHDSTFCTLKIDSVEDNAFSE